MALKKHKLISLVEQKLGVKMRLGWHETDNQIDFGATAPLPNGKLFVYSWGFPKNVQLLTADKYMDKILERLYEAITSSTESIEGDLR